jgi:hypothetical protein
VPIVLESGSLKFQEPSGPVQAFNGIALPVLLPPRIKKTPKKTASLCNLPYASYLNTSARSRLPVQVIARSKDWISGRSLFGIAGSNTTEVMDVCLF